MAYSTVVTYVLWLTLGWLGVHHFYIRRDRHAFVWLWTLGGGCGVGWLMEIFRLPEYVQTANMEALHASGQREFFAGGQGRIRPRIAAKRFIGMFVFSMWMGCLVMTSIPEEITDIYPWLIAIFTPAGVAIGVHTVANIGTEQCDLIICFVTAYVMFPFFLTSSKEALSRTLIHTAFLTPLAVSINCWDQPVANLGQPGAHWWIRLWRRLHHLLHEFSSRSRRYRKTAPERRPVWKRIVIFSGCSSVALILLLSALYYNTYITTDYGEQVKVRVALENIFSSPAWTTFKETGWKALYVAWERGSIRDFFGEFQTALDPEGEQSAYKILNLTQSATEKEINALHKEFVRKSHPDRFPNVDGEEKKKIEDRFIEIQQAFERVSKIKAKRMRKNKISDEL